MLLAGIFPAEATEQKVMECSRMNKKSGTHNIHVPGIMGTHNILQLFLWQALECSEISSPIIEPIIFSSWVPIKKFLNFMRK